jgi:hypothetical protein
MWLYNVVSVDSQGVHQLHMQDNMPSYNYPFQLPMLASYSSKQSKYIAVCKFQSETQSASSYSITMQ